MYQDFPSYINSIYETLKMSYIPFDRDGQYISPNAESKEVEFAYRWYKQKCELLKKTAAHENQQQT
jgi:hypothetical protein